MTEALKWPRTEVDLCSRWHISLPYVTCYIFYLFFGPLRNSYTLCSKKSDAKIQITSSTDILLGAALKPLLTFHQTHRSYQDGILWVKRHNQWIGFHSYFFLLAVTGYDFHHILFFFSKLAVVACAIREWWSVNEPDTDEVRTLALSDSDAQLVTAFGTVWHQTASIDICHF